MVKSDKHNPIKMSIKNTVILSFDKPENVPNDQIMNCFTLSETEKYSKKLINELDNDESKMPMMIKVVLDFKKLWINNNKIRQINAPIKAEKAKVQLLHNAIPIVLPKININRATPNPENDEIPKIEGSAKGFLNNSCSIKPETGNVIPQKIAAKDLFKRNEKIALGNEKKFKIKLSPTIIDNKKKLIAKKSKNPRRILNFKMKIIAQIYKTPALQTVEKIAKFTQIIF